MGQLTAVLVKSVKPKREGMNGNMEDTEEVCLCAVTVFLIYAFKDRNTL